MTGAELSRVDAEDADEVAVAPAHVVHRDTKVLGAPDEDVPMAVDPPAGKLTSLDLLGVDLSQRRMIVPKWLRSPAEARQVAEWLVRYVGHVVTFHITRAPKYAVKGVWQGCGARRRSCGCSWRGCSTLRPAASCGTRNGAARRMTGTGTTR